MFVKGGFDIANSFAGENENALFFLDPGFTVNGVKDDFSFHFFNPEDCSCLQTQIITHILGNNDPSEPV